MRRFPTPFDHTASEFIQLSEGRLYLKKFEVNGLEWEKQYEPHDDGDGPIARLKVYVSDHNPIYLYGDDARAMMAAFELPLDPPWTQTSDSSS